MMEAREADLNIDYAEMLQRKGLTMTEIASRMNVDRSVIVEALYTQRTFDLVLVPDFEPVKRQYAGRAA